MKNDRGPAPLRRGLLPLRCALLLFLFIQLVLFQFVTMLYP